MVPIDGLTVLVTTFNEEVNVRDCLQSASFAGEIMVVDSNSTDRTVEIAKEFTGNIIQHEYVTPAKQKNWALPKVKTDWVFILDADERISEELAAKVRKLIEDPTHDGYSIRRRSYFFGRMINHCGWQHDYVLRLFKVGKGRYDDHRHVHESIILDGTCGRIAEPLIHHTYTSFEQYFEKFNRYTTWAALDLKTKGKRASWWNLHVKPKLRFFRQYILNGGFLDGRHGYLLCKTSEMSVLFKYAKLWDLEKKEKADSSGGK